MKFNRETAVPLIKTAKPQDIYEEFKDQDGEIDLLKVRQNAKGIGGVILPKPDFGNLANFKKDFYLEHPEVMLLDPEEIAQIKN